MPALGQNIIRRCGRWEASPRNFCWRIATGLFQYTWDFCSIHVLIQLTMAKLLVHKEDARNSGCFYSGSALTVYPALLRTVPQTINQVSPPHPPSSSVCFPQQRSRLPKWRTAPFSSVEYLQTFRESGKDFSLSRQRLEQLLHKTSFKCNLRSTFPTATEVWKSHRKQELCAL